MSVGVGSSPTTLEVKLSIENLSIFPMVIHDVIVKNENNELVQGDVFTIQLNGIKRFNVNRRQLDEEPELRNHLHIFEPFSSLYIQGKDENNSYNILIENANFHSIQEVTIKARIFGILPYQYSYKLSDVL